MAIDSENIELFNQGEVFNQIHFLDNFYENVFIEKETSADLCKFLISAINNSANTYVKRSAFKILCDLTLTKKIINRFPTLGLIQDFLSYPESTLQLISLKYLPHFSEIYTQANIEEMLKVLSDSTNGEISSQAYLCLGIVQLSSNIMKTDITELILNLAKAKLNFHAADQATENRVDANFYLLLIDWIESILVNDLPSAQAKFNELERNLQIRSLYEFEISGLELDFQIFKLTQQIKACFEISGSSKEWLEIQPQVQALLNISMTIEKIRDAPSTNKAIIAKLSNSIFENIEKYMLNMHLATEKQRLQALRSQTQDSNLMHFIEYLLSIFTQRAESKIENLELLSLLSENLGSEEGVRMYQRITKNEVPLLKAVAELLRKNKNNQLTFRTGSIHGQEILMSLMSQISELLPNYPPDKYDAFFNIVEEVIRYVRASQVGHDKKKFQFLFSESENGKGQKAVEQDLQDSMYIYLEHSKIADGLEHEKARFVDGGRVDIVYKKDLITIPIELKKSLNRPDDNTMEQNYIAQAQTYISGYDQLGIFVLMELSDKAQESPPNFKDRFKVHHLPPSTNQKIEYPDYVISIIIPGNRTTPSAKSIYK